MTKNTMTNNTMTNNKAMLITKTHKLSSACGSIGAGISMGMIICVCLLIFLVIFHYGSGAISWQFLISEPNASAINTEAGGILTPMLGTVILTIIGILIAAPFALATSIYLTFYAKKGLFKTLVKSGVDILSGVPTIVIALFALVIFTQPYMAVFSAAIEGVEGANRAYGKSFLVAGITMAVMILPFVIKAMEESLKNVPQSYIDGSYALGTDKWGTIRRVVLKSARDGLVTGTILGMGRIIGDTAIVWLTLGGTIRMTGNQPWYAMQNWWSTLTNTGCTLTSYIYFTSPAGEGNHYTVAFGASLVLIAIIIILNMAATLIGSIGETKND